jgi:polysaccharide pyruvyl transferase WcaK-like protein
MTMSKVGVVGWYGHGNCGDESYKLSFPLLFPQHEFVFSETAPEGLPCILGGGDIVCEAFLKSLARVPNKHILSASITKPTDLSAFRTVAVRDLRSISIASEAGVSASYCPDFAFALGSDAAAGRERIKQQFRETGYDLYNKTIVCVINCHLNGGHVPKVEEAFAFQHFAFQLARAFDNTPASVLFVPFSYSMPWDDRATNAWIGAKCKFWKKNIVAYQPYSVQETIDIIAAADLVISTRLHSTIFACATGTPFIDITHNHKNAALLETLGLNHHSIQYRSATSEILVERMKRLLNDGQRIKEELTNVANKQRSILRSFAQNLKLV